MLIRGGILESPFTKHKKLPESEGREAEEVHKFNSGGEGGNNSEYQVTIMRCCAIKE